MNIGNRNSQHSFAQIPSVNTPRSTFKRSFAVKDTFDFDYLVPHFIDEILPGDTCNLNVKSFARLAPQVVPLMDNMFLDYYYFFIPTRLVWNNWEKFNGAQTDPGDSTDFLIPKLADGANFAVGTIFDKMGLPTGVANITTQNRISALPFRAINLIWNEWFRDQNLQDSLTVLKDDGPDPIATYALVKGARAHDYFTSALPWPQKGDAVSLPLGSSAPVVSTGANTLVSRVDNSIINVALKTDTAIGFYGGVNSGAMGNGTIKFGSDTGLEADLSDATAATINQFRQAIMTQSLLELDARGGTRYTEILRAHFNVISPDFRLQRPELLSVARSFISQHVVAQTSETDTTPMGSLAAYSTAAEMGGKVGFSKSFVEHGYVIGLVRARGDITYQQGINKMWTRSTRWDFFWPKLQELGEQAILNKEIYAQGSSADDLVFGYQERYAEYRYKPSEIRGQFRSTYAETLDVWHLAEEFGSLPALNATFIQSNTPIERSLEVTEGYPHLLMDFFFDYTHSRIMTTYGVPATLGRF